jgi:hypothetical protein
MGFMRSKRTVRALAIPLAMILLAGASCEQPKVTRVTIEPSELTLLVGKTHALTVVVDARGGADRTVEWRSEDASIATVTPSGVVEGRSAGATEVSARSEFDGSKRDAIAVTIQTPPAQHAASVTLLGTGTGAVSSEPAGIECGQVCDADFDGGTSLTLTASATTGSSFEGWGGACAGTLGEACTLSMTEARTVTATFDKTLVEPQTLTVTRAGTGTGTVTSSPAAIDCGTTCSAQFERGTSVTLTANAAWGSVFSGWSGACTGTATTCTASMTQARSVTATFGQLVIDFAPPNDDFADSLLLTGASGSTTGSNRFTTKEAGEPPHAYRAGAWNAGGKSVWWRWTSTFTGWVAFDTFGSSFDTMLGAYTGSAVHELTYVGFNDDAPGRVQSRVVFPVRGGVTYRIAVDGFRLPAEAADEGDVVLNWGVVAQPTNPPLNDAFVWSIPMRGPSGTTTGTNLNATKEAGEPDHWGDGGASVWWHWTAPSTGNVTITTFGSTFDTVLAVYTGSTPGGLHRIAMNDDSAGTAQSRVRFPTAGGVTYRIAVDSFPTIAPADPQTGIIVLNWGP